MPLPGRQQTFAYESCRDLLDKLEREVDRYRASVRDDTGVEELKDIAFNAAVTAWHLGDWVFKDLTPAQRRRLGFNKPSDLQKYARENCRALYLCRYAATASKHWVVDSHPDPSVKTVVTADPEWSIYFVDHGVRIPANQVFEQALGFWSPFIYGNEIAINVGCEAEQSSE